ncbi:MAG: hypothetical protein KDK07_05540 [Bauldia sp.]|nr:hypothetical protein [Bauldia sp.]
MSIAPLIGGRFVSAVTIELAGAGYTDIFFSIRDTEGILKLYTQANTTNVGVQRKANVTGLLDGGFLVSWNDVEAGLVRAQRFDAVGAKVGVEFVLSSINDSHAPMVVTLADGRIGFAREGSVLGSIWDPRSDPIEGSSGNDVLTSRLEGATVRGKGGNDRLIDGAKDGDDRYDGGAGSSDTVDYSRATAGIVVDLSAATDQARGSQIGIDQITGVESVTGGAASDQITGDANANILKGGRGQDTLDGRGNADVMKGGANDDTYIVDNAGDVVDEMGGSGRDTVKSSVSFNLADTVHAKGAIENLTLIGSGVINATGNNADNLLRGNSAANTLRAGDDADDLFGGDGNDIEFGDDGKDSLSGGEGNDRLTGGLGSYAFYFDAKTSKANVDHVTDFLPGADEIILHVGIFKKLKLGELKSKAFFAGKNADQAKDGKDRIIVDTKTGECFYDKDGKGGAKAKLFAILDTSPDNIGASDFLVVS